MVEAEIRVHGVGGGQLRRHKGARLRLSKHRMGKMESKRNRVEKNRYVVSMVSFYIYFQIKFLLCG
jgi:hypothetical protein